MSYYSLVQEIKGNLPGTSDLRANQSELDKRMQVDVDLLHLAEYVIKDKDGKVVPGVVNVTLNRPAVFAANVISSLGSAKQQVVVETENKAVDVHLIEDFVNAALAAADRRLRLKGMPLLNPFADTQFCLRGRCARRILLRKVDGVVVPDITNWDGRYTYYEPGEEGLKWGAYETIRSKDEILAEYGEGAAAKLTGREGSVLDVWNDQLNEIWINGAKVKEEGHNYGFCPVVIQVVSLGYGSMLLDRNWQKYEGESIFFMVRDIVPEVNRLASILQTLNMNELFTAVQYRNPQGTPKDLPPEYPEMRDVVSVGAGGLDPIRLGEAKQAAMLLYNMMEKAFQEGSYTDIDIGNVRQPFSAVALVTIGESKDMVYLPRLAAKELLNTATAEMLIRQAIQMGGAIELGVPGHKRSFATDKLKGEYDISFKYFVKTPKIDIARMSEAETAAKWYPREYIYEEVLQVEDPAGMMRDWYSQEAELFSPGVKQHRIIMSLLDKAEETNDENAAREAMIMANELGIDRKMPEVPRNGEVLPLLGEGGQVGGLRPNKVASLLQGMPQEASTD